MADTKKPVATKSAAKKTTAAKNTATKKKPAAAAKKTATARKTAKSPIKKSVPSKTVAKIKANAKSDNDFAAQAREKADFAKAKAGDYANDAKLRTGDALRNLGKVIADTAAVIDENLGARYGDYARTAGSKVSSFGDTVEKKDLTELGNDTREFVKKSPGVAIGIAAVAGFLITRMLKSGSDKD